MPDIESLGLRDTGGVHKISGNEPVEHLVQQVLGNEQPEENFRLLFERYQPSVFWFFAKRGFPHDECHDLSQETFLGAYRGLDRYRQEARFETWLFQIAANVYRNTLRNRSAVKRAADEVSLESALEESDAILGDPSLRPAFNGPLTEALEKERLLILHAALGELPRQMRQCVILRLDQDLSYQEIADVLQVSIETVKTQLHRARRRLKGQLADYFVGLDFEICGKR